MGERERIEGDYCSICQGQCCSSCGEHPCGFCSVNYPSNFAPDPPPDEKLDGPYIGGKSIHDILRGPS